MSPNNRKITGKSDFDILADEAHNQISQTTLAFLRTIDKLSFTEKKSLLMEIAANLHNNNLLTNEELLDLTAKVEFFASGMLLQELLEVSYGIDKLVERFLFGDAEIILVDNHIGVLSTDQVSKFLNIVKHTDNASAGSIVNAIIAGLQFSGHLTETEADEAYESFHPADGKYKPTEGAAKVFNLISQEHVRLITAGNKTLVLFRGVPCSQFDEYKKRMMEVGILKKDNFD
jgi:hypothetical protein